MEQEKINKIIELYKLGVPKTKIAKQLNCSTPTVLKYIRQMDIEQQDTMIGKTFGQLLVIKRAERKENLSSRCIRYTCQCSCGNILDVDGGALRSGHTKSCGCSRKNSAPYVDLTNQRFGKLTALYIIDSVNGRKVWHCKCDCGNECNVESHSLTDGHTKSCGCLHSYKEIEIEQILNNLNIDYIKEYAFSDLRGKRNPLRFDFAIVQDSNLVCLIEYQGEQHTNLDNSWHTDLLEEYDDKKRNYCLQHNIPLYEIDKHNDLKERIVEILNKHGYRLC